MAQTTSAPLPPGTQAPDFTLRSSPNESLSLHDYQGRRVILVFYPADWSPVCGDELALYNEILPEFKKYNAEVLGISADGVWCHAAYRESRNLHFPLLSDFEPKGEIARRYNSYRKGEGVAERSLFVIDEDGIVRWSYVSPIDVNPGADGVLDALESMTPAATEGGRS